MNLKKWKGTWTYRGAQNRFHGKTGSEEVSAPHEEAAKIIIRGVASKELFGNSSEQGFFEVEVEEIDDNSPKIIH